MAFLILIRRENSIFAQSEKYPGHQRGPEIYNTSRCAEAERLAPLEQARHHQGPVRHEAHPLGNEQLRNGRPQETTAIKVRPTSPATNSYRIPRR